MADWEDEPGPSFTKEIPRNDWEDEDAEEDEVKESWEDEEEPAAVSALAPATGKLKKKAEIDPSKDKGKAILVESDEETQLDPVAEKFRQQRIVEEADLNSVIELFGSSSADQTLDTFIPKSENDFLQYAELLSRKLRPYEKSYHYIGLLKSVMRLSMTSLNGADAKEIASSVTAVANAKIKAEKEANAGKKKAGAKKKKLNVDKEDDDAARHPYDPLDDYDFM